MKDFNKISSGLVWLTQLGFSLITPPIVCTWLGAWLRDRFSLGIWVILVGLLLGIGGAIASALQFYRVAVRKAKEDDNGFSKFTGFNSHD